MRLLRGFVSLLLVTGGLLLPTSEASADGWTNSGLPADSGTACIEGTTGTTGLQLSSTNYGSSDSVSWTQVSGDENNFSITVTFTEGGSPFISGAYFQFWMAFRQPEELCAGASFNPMFFYPPAPPTPRFDPTAVCTPTVTGSSGSSTGTLTFTDLGTGPEIQQLQLDLAAQTTPGTFTYTIDFVCGESEDSNGWDLDIDLSHYLRQAAIGDSDRLPDTR